MSPWTVSLLIIGMLAASLAGEGVRRRIPAGVPVRPLVFAASLALFAAALVAGFDAPLTLALVVVMAFLSGVAGVFSGPWGRS
jgi:hypothetical protein